MADRMKALAALGMMSAEAEERGDAKTVERCALILQAFTDVLGLAAITEQAREKDRTRKRNSRNSADSADTKNGDQQPDLSSEIRGNPGNSTDTSDGSPPLKDLKLTPPFERVVRDVPITDLVSDDLLRKKLEILRERVGDEGWVDVESFLLRRKPAQWAGWVESMVRDVGLTSQFTPADLVSVCRDDPTLEKPLGSAAILRDFLAKARRARLRAMRGDDPPPRRAANSGPDSPPPAPPSTPDDHIDFDR